MPALGSQEIHRQSLLVLLVPHGQLWHYICKSASCASRPSKKYRRSWRKSGRQIELTAVKILGVFLYLEKKRIIWYGQMSHKERMEKRNDRVHKWLPPWGPRPDPLRAMVMQVSIKNQEEVYCLPWKIGYWLVNEKRWGYKRHLS